MRAHPVVASIRSRNLVLIAAGAAVLALASPLAAGAAEAFSVPKSETRPLVLGGVASDVLVGDPAIADVTVVDHHHLLIHGKDFGRTNLVVMDAAGRTLFSEAIVVGAGDEGRVSVFMGGSQSDYSCAVRCEKISGSAHSGAGGPQPSGPGAAVAAPIQAALSQ